MYYISSFKICLFVYAVNFFKLIFFSLNFFYFFNLNFSKLGEFIFVNNFDNATNYDLGQLVGFGILIILPIHLLLQCSYLGVAESQINDWSYKVAKKNFLFNYNNLNPIRDIKEQLEAIKKMKNDENNKINGLISGFKFNTINGKRNVLAQENLIIKAL